MEAIASRTGVSGLNTPNWISPVTSESAHDLRKPPMSLMP